MLASRVKQQLAVLSSGARVPSRTWLSITQQAFSCSFCMPTLSPSLPCYLIHLPSSLLSLWCNVQRPTPAHWQDKQKPSFSLPHSSGQFFFLTGHSFAVFLTSFFKKKRKEKKSVCLAYLKGRMTDLPTASSLA